MVARAHILLLEPYYGGSHKAFLTGLVQHVDCHFTLLSLPARKWKMRMQLAAPWFAERICEQIAEGMKFDAILTSTFLDVAVLRSLLASQGITLPLAVYFHENQFSYPGQVTDPGIFQFTAINFTSALCADSLAFNSQYNLETFLSGVRSFLKKSTDMELRHLEKSIKKKAIVLYPGLDFSSIDAAQRTISPGPPVIVWNHRWEHDKDPDLFFHTLFNIQDMDFQLIVLGQKFRYCPAVFAKAREILAHKIIHFGYAATVNEYTSLLKRGDIVVSTARHEFFGISILEGIRAGCRPVVPDKLSYQELLPATFRYRENTLQQHLSALLLQGHSHSETTSHTLTEPYSWSVQAPLYRQWLTSLTSAHPER